MAVETGGQDRRPLGDPSLLVNLPGRRACDLQSVVSSCQRPLEPELLSVITRGGPNISSSRTSRTPRRLPRPQRVSLGPTLSRTRDSGGPVLQRKIVDTVA